MRRKPAQCGYYFSESIGPADCAPDFLADGGDLRSFALRARVRLESILADAALAAPSGSTKFENRLRRPTIYPSRIIGLVVPRAAKVVEPFGSIDTTGAIRFWGIVSIIRRLGATHDGPDDSRSLASSLQRLARMPQRPTERL